MINKKEFSKIAKRIFHAKSSLQNPRIMNPSREWGIGLLIGFAFFIATAGWSAQTYLSNKNVGDITSDSSQDEVIVYRASMVEAALKAYEQRNQKHQQLLNKTYVAPPVIEEIVEEDTVDETSTSSENAEAVLPEQSLEVNAEEVSEAEEEPSEPVEVAPDVLLSE